MKERELPTLLDYTLPWTGCHLTYVGWRFESNILYVLQYCDNSIPGFWTPKFNIWTYSFCFRPPRLDELQISGPRVGAWRCIERWSRHFGTSRPDRLTACSQQSSWLLLSIYRKVFDWEKGQLWAKRSGYWKPVWCGTRTEEVHVQKQTHHRSLLGDPRPIAPSRSILPPKSVCGQKGGKETNYPPSSEPCRKGKV